MAYDGSSSDDSHSEGIKLVVIFMSTWQFFTNNNSPDILVHIVASHHCLEFERKRHGYNKHASRVDLGVERRGMSAVHAKIAIQTFLLKPQQSFVRNFSPMKISCYIVL